MEKRIIFFWTAGFFLPAINATVFTMQYILTLLNKQTTYVLFLFLQEQQYVRNRKAALRKKLSLHNKENILVSRLFDDQVSLELLLLQIQTALAQQQRQRCWQRLKPQANVKSFIWKNNEEHVTGEMSLLVTNLHAPL